MNETIPTSAVLKGAARAIRERGHAKRAVVIGDARSGPVCANGALRAAVTGGDAACAIPPEMRPVLADAYNALADSLGLRPARRLPDGRDFGIDVPRWNNRAERTGAEVIAALERCAVLEEAKEAAAQPPVAAREEVARA